MTRFLEKEQKTQVNSNLIGVQVRPEVVPPTYEVSELTANVRIDKFECGTTSNGLTMVVSTGNTDDVWAYTGTQEEHNSTVYNVWSCLTDATAPNMLTISTDTITDQTQFYIYYDDPNNPVVATAFVSSYMLSYEGSLYRFDPNGYYYVYDGTYVSAHLNGNAECELVDGFFKSRETGQYLGQYTSNSLDTDEGVGCVFGGQYGEYTLWMPDYSFQIVAPAYLFSTIRNPYVGYNLISNMNGTASYASPVTSVTKEEVDPGYTEEVNCTVSYSVDGETWTVWEENLTDDNNVIANIPRYMYLKFGQDVEITEE